MKTWWHDLKLSKKLILVLLTVSLLPLITFAVMAFDGVHESIVSSGYQKLEAVRNIKRSHIKGYMQNVIDQLVAFSESQMLVQGMRRFKEAYELAAEEYEVDENRRAGFKRSIRGYCESEFLPVLKKETGIDIKPEACVPARDNSVALQAKYMVLNSNPPPEKEKLDGAYDESTYTAVHEQYHPMLRSYKRQFGYDDIFLVDRETGVIVYSVYKKVDYCTSLLDGPYKDTNLGRLFQKTAKSEQREVELVDFEPYNPSLGKLAAFVAVPILDRRDNVLGIIIFQMSIDKINQIMTSNRKWDESGLGKSGECYLIGVNRRLRSESRSFLEDSKAFVERLRKEDIEKDLIKKIVDKKSVIDTFEVKSESSAKALSGEVGVMETRNYRGEEVLSAYSPMDIKGLRWGLICELGKDEAVKSSYGLLARMMVIILLFSAALIGAARYTASSISKPLIKMNKVLGDAVDNADLTVRLPALFMDEVGDVGRRVNAFMERVQELMRDVHQNSMAVSASSCQLSATSEGLAVSAGEQKKQTEEIVHSVKELVKTSEEINRAIENTRKAAVESSELTVNGGRTIQKSIDSMKGIASQTEELSENINSLSESAGKIGKIVDVINDVADQTNLLALNAAIEAARAGDAGRGFAVVADEVRKLAVRTAGATGEITVIIRQLQDEAWKTNRAMSSAASEVKKGSDMGRESLEMLERIIERGSEIQDEMAEIAASITQENVSIETISSNGDAIFQAVCKSGESVKEVADTSERFAEDAEVLKNKVELFKI